MSEVQKIDLGCMNAWDLDSKPILYVKHEKDCAETVPYQHMLGKPGRFEIRIAKVFPSVKQEKIGHFYHRSTCSKCGITWTCDSGG